MNSSKKWSCLLGLVLSLVLCVALLPNRVSAGGQTYNIKVNSIAVSDTNKDDILSNGKVKYDPTTDTLTVSGNLDSAFEVVGNDTCNIVMNSDDSTKTLTNGKITISQVNNITVDVDISDRITSYDTTISCNGNVIVKNTTGMTFNNCVISKAANVDISSSASESSYTYYVINTADITCSGTIKIENKAGGQVCPNYINVHNATDVSIIGNGTYYLVGSTEISCSGNVLLSNTEGMIGKVKIQKANNVTATTDKKDFRMFNGFLDIKCSGDVNLSNSSGLLVEEGLSIESSGGSVTLSGSTSSDAMLIAPKGTSIAIESKGDVEIANAKGRLVTGNLSILSTDGGVDLSGHSAPYLISEGDSPKK